MDGASDSELVGRIAAAASQAVLAQTRAIVADRKQLRSVTLELSVTPKGHVACVDSFVSRRMTSAELVGLSERQRVAAEGA
jgi:hypothetical protein